MTTQNEQFEAMNDLLKFCVWVAENEGLITPAQFDKAMKYLHEQSKEEDNDENIHR